jgi:ABC-type Mn2+/Zn2+ transport system ATPase subunit
MLSHHPSPVVPYPHVPHDPDAPILDVRRLEVRYDGRPALESVTFHLHAGERVAVVGPNGAVKSTLFKVIAGVLPPASGEVKISGFGPGGHICIAYVPQRTQVDWRFPASVEDVVMMGRIGRIGLFGWPGREDWDTVHTALEAVDMQSLAGRQIGELSGGQQQRMFLARALAQEAELVLMDEPLNGLDLPSQEAILGVLDGLRQWQITVMVATHDLGQAAKSFDRVMLLNRRLIRFGAPGEVLTTDNLVQAYGGNLRLDPSGMVVVDECCPSD